MRSNKTIPIDIYTLFLYECRRCHKLKLKKLEGHWANDDDDDDDRDPPNESPMSPDDYFEKLAKENL